MTKTKSPAPILLIAFDAAEPRLIEQWLKEGALPNLKRLCDRGSYTRLSSTANLLAGSPWPTFYTGTSPSHHGLYHFLQWRAEKRTLARPNPDWMPLSPFWRGLGKKGKRVIAIDIPMTFQPEPFNGIEVSGWASHDRLAPPSSHPPSLMEWIYREFGPPPLKDEMQGLQQVKSLLQLRDELVQSTRNLAHIAKALINRENWDLFILSFGATHRGGHKLWDLSNTTGNISERERKELSQSLKEVYVACDTAAGRLFNSVDESVTKLVFSLHGMGPNTSRVNLLPDMLNNILGKSVNEPGKSGKNSYLKRLRLLIPDRWRHKIKRKLPSKLQDRLTTFWRLTEIDWSVTPAFNLIADLQGYIRINQYDREETGIVKPGEEYDQLCTQISEGLYTFIDANTGKPIVENVKRSEEIFDQGSRQNLLPDLIVTWTTSPASNHKKIISSKYGTMEWPTPGRNPDGRSGNHRSEGFLIIANKHVKPGSIIRHAHILDLAPTIFALLNVPKPTEMSGNAIPTLIPS